MRYIESSPRWPLLPCLAIWVVASALCWLVVILAVRLGLWVVLGV